MELWKLFIFQKFHKKLKVMDHAISTLIAQTLTLETAENFFLSLNFSHTKSFSSFGILNVILSKCNKRRRRKLCHKNKIQSFVFKYFSLKLESFLPRTQMKKKVFYPKRTENIAEKPRNEIFHKQQNKWLEEKINRQIFQ